MSGLNVMHRPSLQSAPEPPEPLPASERINVSYAILSSLLF